MAEVGVVDGGGRQGPTWWLLAVLGVWSAARPGYPAALLAQVELAVPLVAAVFLMWVMYLALDGGDRSRRAFRLLRLMVGGAEPPGPPDVQ